MLQWSPQIASDSRVALVDYITAIRPTDYSYMNTTTFFPQSTSSLLYIPFYIINPQL